MTSMDQLLLILRILWYYLHAVQAKHNAHAGPARVCYYVIRPIADYMVNSLILLFFFLFLLRPFTNDLLIAAQELANVPQHTLYSMT